MTIRSAVEITIVLGVCVGFYAFMYRRFRRESAAKIQEIKAGIRHDFKFDASELLRSELHRIYCCDSCAWEQPRRDGVVALKLFKKKVEDIFSQFSDGFLADCSFDVNQSLVTISIADHDYHVSISPFRCRAKNSFSLPTHVSRVRLKLVYRASLIHESESVYLVCKMFIRHLMMQIDPEILLKPEVVESVKGRVHPVCAEE